MMSVTFPDGASRQFEAGATGFDIAKSISPSLAKRTVAMILDGELRDLSDPDRRRRQHRIRHARRSARAGAHSP